ncbi:MAG: hypothetical protein NWF00_00430 [Candidatus Bathyarchaeota archaeon]|nr:hypothetical protein [Candidatus Bathyarchaeota archaeon]
MDFSKAIYLHRTITAYCSSNMLENPTLGIYDFQTGEQSYVLCVKTQTKSDSLSAFLETVAQTQKLELKKFKGYFVMHSLGGWSLHEN